MNWIETHGLILLGVVYVYALIVSAMPPLPPTAGWWTIFFYRALQVTAANADKVAHNSPAIQRFTSSDTTDGKLTHSETATSIPVAVAPEKP